MVVADYDRDGKLDLYVTPGRDQDGDLDRAARAAARPQPALAEPGNWQFAGRHESSGASGGDRSTFTAVWLDADEDGWPDLYVPNEFGSGVLLVNQRDGTFREQRSPDPGDFGTMGVTAGDFDNDGHIDIYAGNMYSKAGNRVIGNLWPGTYPEPIMARLRSFTTGSQLHRNLGGLKFEQIGRELQVADVGWAYGPALADLNNDGWLDIYATCGFISRPATTRRVKLRLAGCRVTALQPQRVGRRARRGRPLPRRVLGQQPLGHRRAGPQPQLLRAEPRVPERPGQGFLDISYLTGADSDGDGRSVVAGDFRNDGQLDLIVRQVGRRRGPPLREPVPEAHYLTVSLRGTRSNRLGIGARLTATVGGRELTRELYPHNSFRSQMPSRVHFGLGDATKIDRLTIRWPSGAEQTLTTWPPTGTW